MTARGAAPEGGARARPLPFILLALVQACAADADLRLGPDSVQRQIDMRITREVGVAPTMGHSVPVEGEILRTPPCVAEARAGEACKP